MTLQGWSASVSRWSVATFGALLAAGATTSVLRAPGVISLLEVGLALVVGLGLLGGGVWLQATEPARRVGRLAVWSLLGVVVGVASLSWFAFVLSLDGALAGDPVVLVLNVVAVSTAVFTLLGYFATRLQHRERKLVESRSRFRALTENSSFAVITADETGTIQYANDAVEALFGYAASELVGESMDALFAEPTDEVADDAVDDDLEAVVPSGVHTFEWSSGTLTALSADGEAVPVRVSFGEYLDGTTHLFTGIVQDVSQRREAEARLQAHSAKVTRLHDIAAGITRAETEAAIYRRVVEGAVELFDCEGAALFLAVNDHLVREAVAGAVPFGHRGERPTGGVGLEDSYASGDIVRIDDTQDTRSTGSATEPSHRETTAQAEEGTEQPEPLEAPRSSMSVPLHGMGVLQLFDDEPGAFTGGDEEVAELLATHVITAHQRVVAETSIRRERDRLEEFGSVLSHDIRNPLSVAQGRLHLARQTDDPEEHLAAVERAHDRIDRLIEDVLALAKQGDEVGETEPVDLELAAREAWATVATDDATLRFDDLGEIEGDRTRLLQLLENLYRNAIGHGGDDVIVTVGTLPRGFYVEDTGPGVPPADREAVFESGYSTDPDGTGFGLAIVAGIVESHGWSIALTEGSDGGARFEISGLEVRPG